MSNICFFTDLLTPNYLDKPFYYQFRKGPFPFNGKYIHSNYLYWILKNNNFSNIKLVSSIDEINKEDVLFFHYDYKNKIPEKTDFIKVQIVSDRPKINYADFFCVNDPYKINKDFLLYEPLPLGLRKKTVNFPPEKFHSNCAEFYVLNEFKDLKKINKLLNYNIKVSFEHNRHVSLMDFDVFFFLRNVSFYNDINNKGSKKHIVTESSYKNACRLFQSWYMETPAIFSTHSAMNYEKKSNYDFLEANTFEEFIECCIKLKNNKDLFYSMVDNCKKRKNEITNNIIANQITNIFYKVKGLYNQKN
jgi:hypothetical protein